MEIYRNLCNFRISIEIHVIRIYIELRWVFGALSGRLLDLGRWLCLCARDVEADVGNPISAIINLRQDRGIRDVTFEKIL